MYDSKKLWYIQNPRGLNWGYEMLNNSFISLGSSDTMSSKVSPVLDALLDEDTRALVDAGFLDNSLFLTSVGDSKLREIQFEQNKAALVALAKAKLAEAKK